MQPACRVASAMAAFTQYRRKFAIQTSDILSRTQETKKEFALLAIKVSGLRPLILVFAAHERRQSE